MTNVKANASVLSPFGAPPAAIKCVLFWMLPNLVSRSTGAALQMGPVTVMECVMTALGTVNAAQTMLVNPVKSKGTSLRLLPFSIKPVPEMQAVRTTAIATLGYGHAFTGAVPHARNQRGSMKSRQIGPYRWTNGAGLCARRVLCYLA